MAKKTTTGYKDKVLVVIPYLASAAQGRELEYAVAGWRKHFLEPHHIVVVGDYDPVVDTGDDITFVECSRVPDIPGQYRCHIDHVHKFREVRKYFPDGEGFIYACDDMYAVNDFTMVEVLFPKKVADVMSGLPQKGDWHHDLYKTKELCAKENLPMVNYVCHLPVYYEWDKLFAIYDKYNCDKESYVVENLYFNTYFSNRPALKLHIDHDNLKCGVYRENPRISYLYDAFRDKIWIQNGVAGWIPLLDTLLSQHYGI